MNHTKEKHDQYYEMAHSPISHIIPKLAAPTIVSMLISSIYNMADYIFCKPVRHQCFRCCGVYLFCHGLLSRHWHLCIGMGSGNYMTRS